jgi:hypothetical protein
MKYELRITNTGKQLVDEVLNTLIRNSSFFLIPKTERVYA